MAEGPAQPRDPKKLPDPKLSMTTRLRRLKFEGFGAVAAQPAPAGATGAATQSPMPSVSPALPHRSPNPISPMPAASAVPAPAAAHIQAVPQDRPLLEPSVHSVSEVSSAGVVAEAEVSRNGFSLGKEWPRGKEIEGQYIVEGVVGRGGMGVVYKCQDLARNRPVAIKCPLAHLVHSASAKQRFVREAETWVNIGWHPNIVRAYQVMEFEWLPRIVLEYADGGSLDELLDGVEHGLDLERGLDIAIQVCWGMAFAHDRGLIHRDMKPHNVLLTTDGLAKVTDLGLVRLHGEVNEKPLDSSGSGVFSRPAIPGLPEGSVLTKDGALGTPAYMAPEQWESASTAEAPADTYAFGVMLYEIFCGQRPFRIPDASAHTKTDHRNSLYKEMHLGWQPPDPRSLRPDLDPMLSEVMLRCIEKKPEDRPENFRVIAGELSRVYEEVAGKPARGEPEESELDRQARLDQAWSLISLGLGCRFRGDLDRSMNFFGRAVATFRELNDRSAMSSCFNNMGIVCQDRGDLEKALAMFQKSLTIKKELGDRAGLSRCYTNIGAIYQARGDTDRALATYAQSLGLKKEIGDREGMGKCYTNMGSIYRERREYERALGMYELGLAIAKELNNRAETGSCLNNMGIVHKDRGDYDEAMGMYEESLEIAHELGDRNGVAKSLMNLAILLEEGMNRPKDALRLYEEALKRMKELNMPVPAGLPLRIQKLQGAK